MKKALTAVAVAMLVAVGVADAKSYKRGVGENQFSLEAQMSPIEPGVSWYYNWGHNPGNGYENQVINFKGFEFIPMCWNGVDATKLRTYYTAHPEVKYILGFNEPNFKAQANMTPEVAAQKWPEVLAVAKEFGLKVVSPALNYSPDAPYQDPLKWMREFQNLVGKDAFDFVAIHCYGGLGVMKTLSSQMHELTGKPVWVTEFCYWPGGAGDVYVAPDSQIGSMVETVEWLEKTDYIYRYAWFKAIGAHAGNNKPNYALEISVNGLDQRELSPQGWVYTYMSDFNPDVWNAVGTTVAASEYITSKSLSLAKGENAACPRPIEISKFNAGAYADYQFDVPVAGKYNLVLTVSGKGEPTRFDPSLSVSLVNGDGTVGAELCKTGVFGLSGADDVYTEKVISVDLPAGHQTLRLADVNPYQPSGIRISTLRLVDAAGIEDVMIDDARGNSDASVYYNMQGQRIENPGSGIYLRVSGGKTAKVALP